MVYGDYQALFADHKKVFAYQRTLGNAQVVVINNFTAEPLSLQLDASLQGLKGKCLISNYAPRDELSAQLNLAPYESFAIAIEQS